MDRERERRGSARTLTALSNPDTLTLPSCTRPLHTSPSHVPFIRPLKPEPVAPPPFSNTPRVVSSRPLLQKAPPPPNMSAPPGGSRHHVPSFTPEHVPPSSGGSQHLRSSGRAGPPPASPSAPAASPPAARPSRPPGDVPVTPARERALHARHVACQSRPPGDAPACQGAAEHEARQHTNREAAEHDRRYGRPEC